MTDRFSSILEQAIKTLYILPRPAIDTFSLSQSWNLIAEDKEGADDVQLANQVYELCLKLVRSYPGYLVSGLRAKAVVVGTFYMVQVARGKHYPLHSCMELMESALGKIVREKSIRDFYRDALNCESVKKTLREINKSCGSPKVSKHPSPKLIKVLIQA